MRFNYKNIRRRLLYVFIVSYFIITMYLHGWKFLNPLYDKIYTIPIGFDTEIYSLIHSNEKGEYEGLAVQIINNISQRLSMVVEYNLIDINSEDVFENKIILNKNKQNNPTNLYLFSAPFLSTYNFVVIKKKNAPEDNGNSYKIALHGNILYHFSKKFETYDFVKTLALCHQGVINNKTIILEKDLFTQFRQYIENDIDTYDITDITLPIEPVCMAVCYDSTCLLRFINKYINLFTVWKNYENSF